MDSNNCDNDRDAKEALQPLGVAFGLVLVGEKVHSIGLGEDNLRRFTFLNVLNFK